MRSRKKFTSIVMPAIAWAFIIALFNSCSPQTESNLKRHNLFSIPLGTLPNEIDWFYREGFRMAGTADIYVHNGLIFIAGGETGKVMVFNSYGDLITFIYDPERNPKPITVNENPEERNITSWHFKNPRLIVASDREFFVDDGIGAGKPLKSAQAGIGYDRVVLRFDMNGRYLGHLGREGFGGSPFPYIASLDIREDGGIVVNCRIPGVWMSYWFDSSGHPIATAKVLEDQLLSLMKGGRVAIYSMKPDPMNWLLHIRLDVYSDSRYGDMPQPVLLALDMNTLIYKDPIVLNYIEADPEKGILSTPPNYLGTTNSGLHCMLSPEGANQYRMVFINQEGRVLQNRRIRVNEETVVYRRFRLQNNGMLTGIFLDNTKASVAWWRSDKLIENHD